MWYVLEYDRYEVHPYGVTPFTDEARAREAAQSTKQNLPEDKVYLVGPIEGEGQDILHLSDMGLIQTIEICGAV